MQASWFSTLAAFRFCGQAHCQSAYRGRCTSLESRRELRGAKGKKLRCSLLTKSGADPEPVLARARCNLDAITQLCCAQWIVPLSPARKHAKECLDLIQASFACGSGDTQYIGDETQSGLAYSIPQLSRRGSHLANQGWTRFRLILIWCLAESAALSATSSA
jgi:hypothetical protein